MTEKEILNLKTELKSILLSKVEEQISVAQGMLQESLDAVKDDTKSTAGDKHETSRAMAQLEQEKAGVQVAKANKMKGLVNTISIEKCTTAIHGAIVKTSKANFYLAQAIGKVQFKEEIYFCISPSAPIAQAMLNKKVGDKIVFNATNQTITEIL